MFRSITAEMYFLEHIMEAMQDLKKRDLRRLKHLLNTKSINGKIIPWSELEDADFMKVTNLLFEYHCPNHVQILMEVLNHVPRKDLAEKLCNKVQAEKEKSEGSIETDGSPAKRQRLSGPAPYHGGYRLSDLEDYAANNQDQLIKQLEDHLEPNLMSKLKERLTQSKLKNSFVFTAKQCYALHSNQELKEFLKKVSSAQKSQRLPQKILDILFPTTESKNKRKAVEQKQNKDNSNSQLKRELRERPLREDRPATSSPAGSPPESEPKNPWKELAANKETGSTPVPPNASSLEWHDSDGENKTPEPVYENMDGDVLQSQSQVHPVEESQRRESKVPKAENSLCDEAIRKWCNMKKEENYNFDYIGMREHEKYGCFVAEDVIRFRSPGDTEYCLLRILQDKDELTRTGKLTKSTEFELQFNMAVMGAPSSDVISSVRDFFQVVPFDHSFTGFEEFFKDVVCKIVLPMLALYKRVQVDLLQKMLDMHVKSHRLQKRLSSSSSLIHSVMSDSRQFYRRKLSMLPLP